jgi:hypothetical protein
LAAVFLLLGFLLMQQFRGHLAAFHDALKSMIGAPNYIMNTNDVHVKLIIVGILVPRLVEIVIRFYLDVGLLDWHRYNEAREASFF